MSEKTKSYIEELNEGVKTLFTSKRWQDYLTFLSRFHSYSINNTLAIYLQRPDASLVASFTDWKKQNRLVKRGEKGIRIIAPHVYKFQREDGTEEDRVGFHLAYCFDVSQTDGEDLPASPCTPVDVELSDGPRLLDMLCKVAPCPVSFEEFDGSANGYYDGKDNKIVVKSTLSDAMKVRCLLHETAHALLDNKYSPEKEVDQRTREVRAESVSFCASKYLGIDTSGYSFGYVANWSRNKTLDELKASVSAITKTADAIIKTIENLQP